MAGSIEFLEPANGVLLPQYFRNNKSMGIKNIQCFPKCVSEDKTNGIHKVGRSCVGSIIVKHVCRVREGTKLYVKAFAKFSLAGTDKEQTKARNCDLMFKVGSRISDAVIEENRLTRTNKTGVLFVSTLIESKATQLGDNTIQYENIFEFKPRTWHYAWRGGRYRKSLHCVDITVCSYNEAGIYVCEATIKTSAFRVLSNRTLKNRRKKEDEDEKAVKKENHVCNHTDCHQPDEMSRDSIISASNPTQFNKRKRSPPGDMSHKMLKVDPRYNLMQSRSKAVAPVSPSNLLPYHAIMNELFDGNVLTGPLMEQKDNAVKREYDLHDLEISSPKKDFPMDFSGGVDFGFKF